MAQCDVGVHSTWDTVDNVYDDEECGAHPSTTAVVLRDKSWDDVWGDDWTSDVGRGRVKV